MKWMPVWAPALVGAAVLAAPAVAQDYAFISSNLFGDYIREGGAEDATADFSGEADFVEGTLCYYLEFYELEGANALELHRAEAGEDGPMVLELQVPADANDEVCVEAEEAMLRAITDEPEEYYLLVRSEGHPDGAIRGQMGS